MIIYAGDSKDVIKRIRNNHCSGNIESSALRKHIATTMGYKIKKTIRPSGSTRIRIDHPDPKMANQKISEYIHTGKWKYVLCASVDEAKDFQWFMIELLKPIINKMSKPWNQGNLQKYNKLKEILNKSPYRTCKQLHCMESGPGVYVLYHQKRPK